MNSNYKNTLGLLTDNNGNTLPPEETMDLLCSSTFPGSIPIDFPDHYSQTTPEIVDNVAPDITTLLESNDLNDIISKVAIQRVTQIC